VSLIGILSSNLFAAGSARNAQSSQNNPSKFQQIKTEFQLLGEDLQSGNLSQAQTDFASLSKDFPGAAQSSATSVNTTANNDPLLRAFTQLGRDLQSGNLQAAQQDYTNLRQDLQLISSQQAGRHHHHSYVEGTQSASPSSQETNPIPQAFRTLAQDLQAGNLSAAQSAFATLQSDLQQIGGFLPGGSSGTNGATTSVVAGSLNVTA
jgi:hypothetical protein